MTVASTLNKVTIAGNGATTSFPFNFAMPGVPVSQAAALLVVTVVSSSGVSTVIPFGPAASQYQLSLNPAVSPSPTPVGGIVTYNPLGVPLPTGSTLTIQRILPETQLSSFSGQGTLWPTVVESTLDYLTMTVQQLQSLFGNFFQAPQTDPVGLNYTTPAAAQRANQALGFDGSGNLTTFTVLPAGTVSSAMAPVVNAATLAAGRTAFGLGTMATEGIGAALQDDGAGNVRVVFAVNKLNISTAITSANFLQKIKATGPITLTLPRANTLWPGFGFWIEVLQAGSTIILSPNAADQIESFGSGVSINIPVGTNLFITTDGATNAIWYIELSPTTTVNSTPQGTFKNLVIRVLTDTTASATADFVSVSDGLNFSTVVPTGGINFATVGAGGIDTGAIATNSVYAVYVIYNPLSRIANWLVSLNFTTPSLPSGFTQFARLGSLRTSPAGATLLGTLQAGRDCQYIHVAGLTRDGVPLPVIISGVQGTVGTPSTWVGTSVSGFLPSTALKIKLVLHGQNGLTVLAAPNKSYVNNEAAPMHILALANTSDTNITGEFLVEDGNVYFSSNGAAGSLSCFGWTDNIN